MESRQDLEQMIEIVIDDVRDETNDEISHEETVPLLARSSEYQKRITFESFDYLNLFPALSKYFLDAGFPGKTIAYIFNLAFENKIKENIQNRLIQDGCRLAWVSAMTLKKNGDDELASQLNEWSVQLHKLKSVALRSEHRPFLAEDFTILSKIIRSIEIKMDAIFACIAENPVRSETQAKIWNELGADLKHLGEYISQSAQQQRLQKMWLYEQQRNPYCLEKERVVKDRAMLIMAIAACILAVPFFVAAIVLPNPMLFILIVPILLFALVGGMHYLASLAKSMYYENKIAPRKRSMFAAYGMPNETKDSKLNMFKDRFFKSAASSRSVPSVIKASHDFISTSERLAVKIQ